MIKADEVYKIGRLGKTHGIHGEITMQVDDDIFDRTDADYVVLCLDGIMVPFFFAEYRFKTDETALVKFCDIDTQERAQELVGTDVYFPRTEADDDDDELTYAQLVGYTVNDIGKIAFIDDQTDNIMFEMEDGTLIPASEELIVEVDTQNRKITMNLPEGLLDL